MITNPVPLNRLLQELKQEPTSASFLSPVDWRALNLDNYPAIIKHPMDLQTVEVTRL